MYVQPYRITEDEMDTVKNKLGGLNAHKYSIRYTFENVMVYT